MQIETKLKLVLELRLAQKACSIEGHATRERREQKKRFPFLAIGSSSALDVAKPERALQVICSSNTSTSKTQQQNTS